MAKSILKRLILLVSKQYTSIGGQAVIEGVMMRSPNAFVVAVRKPDGSIRLRKDQWYGLSKRFDAFKKPFLRGVLVLLETMANGVVSLNYSANIAMEEELREKAIKKGKDPESFKQKEKVDWTTALTIGFSFLTGIALFVLLPHALALLVGNFFGEEWALDSFAFHVVDGVIKACIFLLYIYLIGFIPDIRRVFQYHGAEHKSISTFEAGEELVVENARKYTTLHPRCGTTFIFFLIFISIILFAGVFTLIKIGEDWTPVTLFGVTGVGKFQFVEVLRHLTAILYKVCLMFPIAGLSYELIKFSGKYPNKAWCKFISFPGMMLQKLTTKEPDDSQLEVALASIRAVLHLEDTYGLKEADTKVLEMQEVDIANLAEIGESSSKLKDFLE